ncbi:hypothetical protein ACMHYB_04770 [Sorangium sp. So ce1128]
MNARRTHLWRIEGTANIDCRLLTRSNRNCHASITNPEPPNVIVHLLKMNPIINDELVENALTFNLHSLRSVVSEHSPLVYDRPYPL